MEEKIKKAFFIAVVCVFGILALIFILNVFTPWYYPSDDLSDKPENLLRVMNEDIYHEKVSFRIDFSKDDSINKEVLASSTELKENQICLSLSDELKEKGFELKDNSLITYSGESSVRTKLAGLCAEKETFVDGSFVDYAPILEEYNYAFDNSCCVDEQKCCVLFLFESDE